MAISRRQVLTVGAGGLGALCAKGVALPLADREAGNANSDPAFASAATTFDGCHWAVGFDKAGQEVFRAPLPMRGHQMTVSADGALIFATPRRPGTQACVIDLATRRVAAVCASPPGRHFLGHAVYSRDGQLLFITENDYNNGRGLVTVRDARTLKVVQEFDSGGIGPHELVWMRDGRTLAVANGGILTHPSQPRKKLNLDSMRPNLSLIDAASGRLLDQVQALNSQASIRHLAVTNDDEVVVGMQYEGSPGDDAHLVAVYRREGGLTPLSVPLDRQRNMRQYTASVAVDPVSGQAAVTCPRANSVTFWSISAGRYAGQQRFGDAGGAAFDAEAQEFVVTNGRGAIARFDARTLELRRALTVRVPSLKWDNHLSAIGLNRP